MEEIFKCMDFNFLLRFLKGLQKLLGDNCEIIVNDFRKGYDHAVVYEVNAQLSGRSIGSSPRGGMITTLGQNIEEHAENSIFYYSGTKSGQYFKSCTTLVADENNRIIGSVCLNLEISQALLFQNVLQDFLQRPEMISQPKDKGTDEILTKNIDDVLLFYIQQCEKIIGKPMSLMTREEKIQALDFLDQKGVFKITKASNFLCDTFKISRYTLYAYLDEAKSVRQKE